jgi:hypothetical protein
MEKGTNKIQIVNVRGGVSEDGDNSQEMDNDDCEIVEVTGKIKQQESKKRPSAAQTDSSDVANGNNGEQTETSSEDNISMPRLEPVEDISGSATDLNSDDNENDSEKKVSEVGDQEETNTSISESGDRVSNGEPNQKGQDDMDDDTDTETEATDDGDTGSKAAGKRSLENGENELPSKTKVKRKKVD